MPGTCTTASSSSSSYATLRSVPLPLPAEDTARRCSSAPPYLPPLTLREAHNGSSGPAVVACAALNVEWGRVVGQWLTRAAIRFRDQPDVQATHAAMHATCPGFVAAAWPTYISAAWVALPKELPQLLESSHLCALFGLDRPVPGALRSALLDAVQGEIVQSNLADPAAQQCATDALGLIHACLQLPMQAAFDHGLLKGMFAALHSGLSFNAVLQGIHNEDAAVAPGSGHHYAKKNPAA